MYTLNTTKNSYVKIADTIEIYCITTDIGLAYNNEETESDQEKDFDHLRQLISIYEKILFFTKPEKTSNGYTFKFGVEQKDLFSLNNDPVGVLKERLNGVVLFDNTIITKGLNTNTKITKEH